MTEAIQVLRDQIPLSDGFLVLLGLGALFIVYQVMQISAVRRRVRFSHAAVDAEIAGAKQLLVAAGVLSFHAVFSHQTTAVRLEIETVRGSAFFVETRTLISAVESMRAALSIAFEQLAAEAEVFDAVQEEPVQTGGQTHQAGRHETAPPAAPDKKRWWDVLGIRPDASAAEVERSWKSLAKTHHPDLGGSTEAMAEINKARDEARSALA